MLHPAHFNPQGPHGPRPLDLFLSVARVIFQSTRPSRASTIGGFYHERIAGKFQSTRPSRASTIRDCLNNPAEIFQSTRPSRASTWIGFCAENGFQTFQSTRPSRASTHLTFSNNCSFLFQSTRPSRASTLPECRLTPAQIYFNPQGPHGPRQIAGAFGIKPNHFNPQGPHGPRLYRLGQLHLAKTFQSTRPSRASTDSGVTFWRNGDISIHKALTGLDRNFHQFLPAFLHFSKHNASFF